MKQPDTSITVALRVRPLNDDGKTHCAVSIIKQAPSNPKVVVIGERGFSFDHVFIKEEQETVFNLLMTPVIEKLLEGINCSVIAYGQTGTGKTYTMGTEPQEFSDQLNAGLISRTAERLFENCCLFGNKLSVSISFVEIYNEEVFELLTDKPIKLDVKGFQIRGLTSIPVKNMDEVGSLLCQGTSNRHTRPTLLNCSSSRSHAIFTFRVCRHNGNDVLLSELHMVDLAGSERAKRTGTRDDAFQEAVCINRGLLELGNVIQSLSSGRHGNHVPYRNSLLTSVLHGSLQVQNMIAMIACVSPSELDMAETVNTLRFVEKSKKVMQAIEINKIVKLHKTGPVVTSSTIRPRHPLAAHNYQYSSVTGNERNRQHGTGTSSSLCNSVCILNTEDNLSSKRSYDGVFISPVVKKCCEQIESNLNEKIEKIVLTTIQKQKKNRMYYVDNVSALAGSPLLNDSRELLTFSDSRKAVFRKEIELFQAQMQETMKSEMRNIVQEEVKVALTSTICSTVEAFRKKTFSHGRGAPLLGRRLDFEHSSSTTVSHELHREDRNMQPRRSTRLSRGATQNISSCKENNLAIATDLPVTEGFIDTGEQMDAITPLSLPFVFLASHTTSAKGQVQHGTPRKESSMSPKRCDSFGSRDRCNSPTHCTRLKTCSVEVQKTKPRRSMRLSLKYLNKAHKSVTDPYSQASTTLAGLNGSLANQHQYFRVEATPILTSTYPSQLYVGSSDTISQCSPARDSVTTDHSSLTEQKSLRTLASTPVRIDSHPHRDGNHHNTTTPFRVKYHGHSHVSILRNSNSNSSSKKQRQPNAIENLIGYKKILYGCQEVVQKKRNKAQTRKVKTQKSPCRRGSTKTSKNIIMMKKLLDVSSNAHQKHMSRIMSILNMGCPRELQKLPSVGPKTALIIFNYRNLAGKTFTSVEDLKKIPGLNKNFHEKFTLANLVV